MRCPEDLFIFLLRERKVYTLAPNAYRDAYFSSIIHKKQDVSAISVSRVDSHIYSNNSYYFVGWVKPTDHRC